MFISDFMNTDRPNRYGIFSGGGVKAAAFAGALLEAEQNIRFVGVGGTSAGSIVSALLACGYTGDELVNVLFEAPYKEILKPHLLSFALDPNQGIFWGAALRTWIEKMLQRKVTKFSKTGVTFADLKDHPGSIPLKIVATSVTIQDIKEFSLAKTPTVAIADAVLASCSFPVLFKPVVFATEHVVDGGVISNFPMWLFDEERREQNEPVPVLGFSLSQAPESNDNDSFPRHLCSIFESVLIAQDRVQERFLDPFRLANVIRIRIPPTGTFESKMSDEKRSQLINAGKIAALEYFKTAIGRYGERVGTAPRNRELREESSDQITAAVSRDHIFPGGVARDDGISKERRFVKYYIDLMEACADREKRSLLASVLATKIQSLSLNFDRIVGLKNGNILLAAETAQILGKPFVALKSNLTYKMGPPFEGEIRRGERVVLVDDIASDSTMLVLGIRQLHNERIQILNVVTLIEREEGDAREKLHALAHCYLESVHLVSDAHIKALVERSSNFPPALNTRN